MNKLLQGKRIYLRELLPADANGNYFQWMQDPEILQFLESRFQKHSLLNIQNFIESQLKNPVVFFNGIFLNDTDRHIGNIKLGPIDAHHHLGDIGIIIGEKDCWGKGFATEAIALIRDFAFQQLNLHKLTAGCYSNNMASANAFIKVGFQIEGKRKAQYLSGTEWVEGVMMGMINEN